MRFLARAMVGLVLVAVTCALLGFAAITVQSAFDRGDPPGRRPPRERVAIVPTTTVTAQTIAPTLAAFGELRAARQVALRAPLSTTVDAMADGLADGVAVAAGQLLFTLNATDAQAALAQAQTTLTDAQNEAATAREALRLAQADLASAQTQLPLRQNALERAQNLRSRDLSNAAALETAELALANAKAAVVSREQAIQSARARITQAATGVTRAKLALADAERTLTDTSVMAPFAGVLTDVAASPGARVSNGETLATLIDASTLDVAFRVSTAQYARLRRDGAPLPAAPVTVTLEAGDITLTANGRLTREAAQVAAGQTGRLLYARLESAAAFRPGDFVTVRVTEPQISDVALIPAAAVSPQGAVLVLNDGRLSEAPVTVLYPQGDDVLIDAAPLIGAQIVSARTPLLGPGVAAQAQGAAAGAAQGQAPDPAQPQGRPADDSDEQMVTLTPERRATLLNAIQDSPMPAQAKTRLTNALNAPQVPVATVKRIEQRLGL